MLQRVVRLLSVVTFAWLLTACAELPWERCQIDCEEDGLALAKSGAVRLGPDEVRAHVTDKTEQWVHGGAYYHESGRLQVRWRKVNYRTFWEVSADGTLCYQLDTWGRRCHYYMEKAGRVYMLEEGINIGVRDMWDGNRMKSVKGYSPPPETVRKMMGLDTNPLAE